MYLAYYDESGDDGFPKYSSPLFVLSACYVQYMHWQDCFDAFVQIRQQLRAAYGIPVKMELHWKYLVLGKSPYNGLKITETQRIAAAEQYMDALAQMNLKFINVAIVKPRIQTAAFDVLDTAFKFSIQRIENDLNPRRNPTNKFMIITDQGRVGAMRKTSRQIRKINFIPSKFSQTSYRREIKALIEDPIAKDSKESHFIQACDLMAYVVYLHLLNKERVGKFAKRIPPAITPTLVESWLKRLQPCLNTQASSTDPNGIVIHPK